MPPVSKTEYKRLAIQFTRQWEQQLDLYNAQVMARQIMEWERVSKQFDRLIQELLQKQNLSSHQLYRLEEYKQFAQEVDKQLLRYAQWNAELTTMAQRELAYMGLQNSNTLLTLINPSFSRLPVEAINKVIGTTAQGSPLFEVFKKRFGERADEATQLLLEGIAQRVNPTVISRNVVNQLGISRYDATRIARTEAMNVYSQVSYDSYSESGIVDSYIWIAESDACSECLDRESNSPYLMDSGIMPTEHPHCRCAIAPHV